MAPMNDAEIRQYLQGHGIPVFIDRFVKQVVQEHPQDFKPLLRNMIKADMRTIGKGAKASAPAGDDIQREVLKLQGREASPPAYCLRDPRMRPTAEQIKQTSVVTQEPTRSEILEPQLNKDYASTVAAQFNSATASSSGPSAPSLGQRKTC